MDAESTITRVENPVYMTQDEINKKYYNRQVLVTNIEWGQGTWAGGIVRYHANNCMRELTSILAWINRDNADECGQSCTFFLGPVNLCPVSILVKDGVQ
jgi:hypothetical protein|uniref:Uncharacterized protein n=1 Tax=uncultured bacterium contig00005 TaxID=1181497 RepID=A0A806KI65_9BACT|nr:hypothetical protein [uncultured bacterium contig00005]